MSPTNTMRRAKLKNVIPTDRYTILSVNGEPPKEGDVVELDQGTTSADGKPMGLVYCVDENGSELYEASVYDYELDLLNK